MNHQSAAYLKQEMESWNKYASGWKKWESLTMDLLKPPGNAIINFINPSGKDNILDIASGTGEPGLTIASMLEGGAVTLIDVAEDMLAFAKANATKRNITNIHVVAADASELPFGNESFDAISCRFGFMFFPNMQDAANEMFRVLKKSGRMATSVWNVPDKNFWVTAIMGTIKKNMEIPELPSGAPSMFRCCKPGLMRNILTQAGFTNIKEQEIVTTLNAGTTETYWNMMTEIGAPIVEALGKADEVTRHQIKQEVFALVKEQHPGYVALKGNAILLTAIK